MPRITRTVAFLALLIAAVTILGVQSIAAGGATGVIQTISYGYGTTGTIVVTDNGGSGIIAPGDVVPFNQPTRLSVGDLVSFDLSREGTAVNLALIATGELLTGPIAGDVQVQPGQVIIIQGGNVAGDIDVQGGTVVITGDSVVHGDLSGSDGASIFISGTSRVVRKIDVRDSYLSVRSPEIFEDRVLAEGYCVKCKAKKEIQGRDASEVTMKNGRKALKGTCPTCGTGMFKILGKA